MIVGEARHTDTIKTNGASVAMTEPPWGNPSESSGQPGQSQGGWPQQPPPPDQGYYPQPGQQGQSGQQWPGQQGQPGQSGQQWGQPDPYAGQQQQPYAAPQQPSYGGYPDQGGYSGQQPATPYLERDPYHELSASNLDQGAYQQQSGYGQQPGYPAAGYPQPGGYPAQQSNGVALAGAICCFIPVLGLILSIIGRAKAKSLGGAGKVAGNVGIVLSLLFTGGAAFAVYKIGNSTAADPACISAESDSAKLMSTLNTDAQSMQDAENSGDATQLTTAGDKFISDMRSLQQQLTADEAKATHDNVRVALKKFDTDLGTFLSGLQQSLKGDSSGDTATNAAGQRLETDGDAIDSLCGNAGNG